MKIFSSLFPLQIKKWWYHKFHATASLHLTTAKLDGKFIFTGFFTGMVLGLQGYHTLRRFGSEAVLVTLLRHYARFGLSIMDIKRAAEDLAKLI